MCGTTEVHTQQFDDGSVLNTRHAGTTFARPFSQRVEDLRANVIDGRETGPWKRRTELENGQTLLGQGRYDNHKWYGTVQGDGTFVVQRVGGDEGGGRGGLANRLRKALQGSSD